MTDAGLGARIDALAERARADRAAFERPDDPPDEERAMHFLRNGVGPALAVYVEGRTGDWVRFEPESFARLERERLARVLRRLLRGRIGRRVHLADGGGSAGRHSRHRRRRPGADEGSPGVHGDGRDVADRAANGGAV